MPEDALQVPSRDAIVEATIAALRRRSLFAVSLESIAADLHAEPDALLAHFEGFDALLDEVVERWNEQRLAPLLPIAQARGAVAFLRAVTRANAADPAFMRLLIGVLNIAAYPGEPNAQAFRQQYARFVALIERTLERDVAEGREPSVDPHRGAEQLLALYEGLAVQALARDDVDLASAYDHAVARLQRGWAAQDSAPWSDA